jgi:hypothetical protein
VKQPYKYYKLYGLTFQSEIDLDSTSCDFNATDITIRLVKELPTINPILFDNNHCFGNHESIQFLSWDNVVCQVNKGREVLINNTLNTQNLPRIIFCHVIPLLMTQRGKIVFHASGNKLESGAVLFIGDNGSGKSTTSAALQQNGFPSIGDDCVTCMINDSGIFAFPTLSNIRLCTGKDSFLDPAITSIKYIDDKVNLVRNWNSTEPIKLSGIFFLNWSDTESCKQLTEKEAFITLIKNIWFPWFTQMTLKENHLKLCANIARQIKVFSHSRPQTAYPSKDAGNFVFNLNL